MYRACTGYGYTGHARHVPGVQGIHMVRRGHIQGMPSIHRDIQEAYRLYRGCTGGM